MRQQLRPDARVHGDHHQGRRPGQHHPRAHRRRVLPARARPGLLPRAAAALRGRRRGRGTATGCTAKVTRGRDHPRPAEGQLRRWPSSSRKNLERIDFPVDPDDGEAGYGSTDCGNVSQARSRRSTHTYGSAPTASRASAREMAEDDHPGPHGNGRRGQGPAMTALDLLAHPGRTRPRQIRVHPPVNSRSRSCVGCRRRAARRP